MIPPNPCPHTTLQLTPSAFAPLAGFTPHTALQLAAATTKSNRIPLSLKRNIEKEAEALSTTFPAPLVLPWDDLNLDPECPGQSLKAWMNLSARNKMSEKRPVIYVAHVPEIGEEVGFMRDWTQPNVPSTSEPKSPMKKRKTKSNAKATQDDSKRAEHLEPPDTSDIIAYLQAFYHGMLVKPLPSRLRFTSWNQPNTTKRQRAHKTQEYVGLALNSFVTRIRTRPTPTSATSSSSSSSSSSPTPAFPHQLNLLDLLDTAISILPFDAHALLLVVNHDIYEDSTDDFCCGRAYGGSRVAVVSSARYNPLLDSADNDIEHAHMWPASHCTDYVNGLLAVEDVYPDPAPAPTLASSPPSASRSNPSIKHESESESGKGTGGIRAAISTTSSLPPASQSPSTSPSSLTPLWFSRLARTSAHELGHCFGIAHCVYYACCMQGTASIAEDVRQPPYLCPVCLAKVAYAIGVELRGGGGGGGGSRGGEGRGRNVEEKEGEEEEERGRKEYVRERYEALRSFCGKWEDVGMFAGYGAWLDVRLEGMA